MQTNRNIKGRAIFSEPEQIKEKSIRVYTYLVCRANLRNKPDKAGDNVRIFQQKDVNLAEMNRILRMDERTIKKCWEGLEQAGLIRFTPRGWKEQHFIEENGNFKPISFNERWKVRRKHKDTYYEMPVSRDQLFRKIPKETLIELNECYSLDELTMKIYITLINFQEECILNGLQYKKFTYADLRYILNYSKHAKIDQQMENSLRILQSLGLLDLEMTTFINEYGTTIPCFILNQANFYVNFSIKNFKPGNEHAIPTEILDALKNVNATLYNEIIKNQATA